MNIDIRCIREHLVAARTELMGAQITCAENSDATDMLEDGHALLRIAQTYFVAVERNIQNLPENQEGCTPPEKPPAQLPTPPPADNPLERGPCVVCGRFTSGTDCGEFLCGVCQRKGRVI